VGCGEIQLDTYGSSRIQLQLIQLAAGNSNSSWIQRDDIHNMIYMILIQWHTVADSGSADW